MQFYLAMASLLSLCSTARAFSTAPAFARATTKAMSSSTARAMSSGPMPHPEDKMPFYALGTNLAMQVRILKCSIFSICLFCGML
jgi:hypothetical protein